MNELWVDIEGYEGKYQVSNLGRVKSLNFNKTKKEKILAVHPDKRTGVNVIQLSKCGKVRKFYVCKLVANHFLPNNNNKSSKVIHINDKLDDSVSNLKYVSVNELCFIAKKGVRKRENDNIRNVYKNTTELKKWMRKAKENGIRWATALERLKLGWQIDDAFTIPTKRDEWKLYKPLYNYKRKWYSLKEIAKITGIKKQTIYCRLYRGWSCEEAFGIPVGKERLMEVIKNEN